MDEWCGKLKQNKKQELRKCKYQINVHINEDISDSDLLYCYSERVGYKPLTWCSHVEVNVTKPRLEEQNSLVPICKMIIIIHNCYSILGT